MKKKPKDTRFYIHEANNILASIFLSLEMMQQGMVGEITKSQQKHIKSVLSDAKKLAATIAEISELNPK